MVLLVDIEVARRVFLFLALEKRCHSVHALVDFRAILGAPGNDERSARLVDQDRVDFVHNRVVQFALEAVAHLHRHVVAQVIEAEFVVGPIGDVCGVGRLLFGVRHLGQDHPHRQAEELVDLPHPLRVAAREVVVDRDDVHAAAGKGIEVRGQGRDQRLAFAGAHLRDLAVVQDHAADELHVEVTHVEHAPRRFANHGERLRQQLGEHGLFGCVALPFGNVLDPLCETLPQLERLGPQAVIRERRHRRLEGVDRPHRSCVVLQQPVIAATEHRLQYAGNHRGMTAVARKSSKFITPERLLPRFGRSGSAGTRAIEAGLPVFGRAGKPASGSRPGGTERGSALRLGNGLRSARAGRWHVR